MLLDRSFDAVACLSPRQRGESKNWPQDKWADLLEIGKGVGVQFPSSAAKRKATLGTVGFRLAGIELRSRKPSSGRVGDAAP